MVLKEEAMAVEVIQKRILIIRHEKVMIDRDLAELYGIETKQLKRAVRRNRRRFPEDFMFELTRVEYEDLRCQFGTFKRGEHSKYAPMAFTEQGVAMLSSVLGSRRAIEVNILIMRAFVRLRRMISSHRELMQKVEEMEKKYDAQFKVVFEAIRQLMAEPEPPRKRIGFLARERRSAYRVAKSQA